MKQYKHILFDLDQTLWDFETNSAETLRELYDEYKFENWKKFSKEQLIYVYQEVNLSLWKKYNTGLVNKDFIRNKRFELTFIKLGLQPEDVPANLNNHFLELCPTKTGLIPFAKELLEYLYPKYSLHIVSNGFKESQLIKLNSTKLQIFFKEIVNSESCGFLKPDKRIFEYTLGKINAACGECIMIGDDLEADILGAKDAGIDHVYLNRSGKLHQESINMEINCLSKLMSVL